MRWLRMAVVGLACGFSAGVCHAQLPDRYATRSDALNGARERADAAAARAVDVSATPPPHSTATPSVAGPQIAVLSSQGQTLVKLADSNPHAVLFYTTDGSDPLKHGTTYGSPFRVARGTKLRVQAWVQGQEVSAVVGKTIR